MSQGRPFAVGCSFGALDFARTPRIVSTTRPLPFQGNANWQVTKVCAVDDSFSHVSHPSLRAFSLSPSASFPPFIVVVFSLSASLPPHLTHIYFSFVFPLVSSETVIASLARSSQESDLLLLRTAYRLGGLTSSECSLRFPRSTTGSKVPHINGNERSFSVDACVNNCEIKSQTRKQTKSASTSRPPNATIGENASRLREPHEFYVK